MDAGGVAERVEALREQCAALGRELVAGGAGLSAGEAFELVGVLQGLVNAAEGAQVAVAAWGARVETTPRGSGSWERVHPVGYVDAMAPSEVSLATGLTEGVAGRRTALGAAVGERFPALRDAMVAGEVALATAHKVVDACAGLDGAACERVDADLSARLPGLDPARVAGEARRVAARVAADQVAAQVARTRRGRLVEVRPGEDGLTDWFASLPTATSAAMWSAVEALAAEYRGLDPELSVPASRADAFSDLVLRDVTVTGRVTLAVPVVTGGPEAPPVPRQRVRVERAPDETVVDAVTGVEVRVADLDEASREAFSWVEVAPEPVGDLCMETAVLAPGVSVSGVQLPGLGWVEPATLAGLLRTVPLEVARAVVEADTGVLTSRTTAAHRPTPGVRSFVETRDGTCRMWGCSRPAERCDLDHVRPWPDGPTSPANLVALCRRHHRMKQRGRWRPVLAADGTVTWHGPDGQERTTTPQHALPT